MTGLAGTALSGPRQLADPRPLLRRRSEKAVEYLLTCATPTGLITGPTQDSGQPMHGHGFALMFLASVYGMITKESLREQVKRGRSTRRSTLTGQGQSGAGGWTYIPGGGDEGSVTVTQVQALRAAHNAGLPRAARRRSKRPCNYLETCSTPEGGIRYSLGSGGGPRLAISAAAVATLYNAGQYDSADRHRLPGVRLGPVPAPARAGARAAATTSTPTSTPSQALLHGRRQVLGRVLSRRPATS